MKIALYGEDLEHLQVSKQFIETECNQRDYEIQVDCFIQQEQLRQQLFQYDGIVLSDRFMQQAQSYAMQQKNKKINFVVGKQIDTIDMNEIYYVEADLKTVHIWKKEQDIIVRLSLSKVEEILKDRCFLKVHRSYIVNGMHTKTMTKNSVILDNGVEIAISKYRYKEVREQYLNLLK